MEPVTEDVGRAVAADPVSIPATPRPDGRRTRWAEHRRRRREELVTAALRAITRNGAGIGMDDLAAAAGTSKTVLYRHFGDKEDLYLAVAERVNRTIVRELRASVAVAGGPREAIAGIVATYVRLVEADPEVYRFVVSHPFLERPASRDPVQGLSGAIADETARTITAHLRAAGARDTSADVLAHGLVAMIRSTADRWIADPSRIPAGVLVHDLTELAWGGLGAVLSTGKTPGRTPEEVS